MTQAIRRTDSTGAPQKRQRDASKETTQRHHSADSPIAKRSTIKTKVTADGSSNSDSDDIFWMATSPRGTLKSALRQRTPASTRMPQEEPSGIVQRMLDSRNSNQSPVRNRKRPVLKIGSSDLSSELDIDTAVDPSETTPIAQRKAVARPLTMSKSEKTIDRRLLLSSLLPQKQDSEKPAGAAEGIGEYLTSSPSLRLGNNEGRPLPPVLEFTHQQQSSQEEQQILDADSERLSPTLDHDSATRADTLTGATATGNDDTESDTDLLCLDHIDMDSLLAGLDPTDDLGDLMDGLEEEVEEVTPSQRYKDCERCLTLLVTDGCYNDTQQQIPLGTPGARTQKIVRVYSQTAVRERIVLLRDEWEATPIRIGDYLNLVGEIGKEDVVVVDSRGANVLPILNPDTLVSCTHLSDSFTCLRRAVLKDRISEITDGKPPSTVMLIGVMLHDLFQSCALKNKWDDATMGKTIYELIESNVERLWECQLDEASVYEQVSEVVPEYQAWAQKYMHGSAQADAQYRTHRGGAQASGSVAVSGILNMEENVWSEKFGLKGKIDLTVLAHYVDGRMLVTPLELKTGRNTENTSHRAQLVMYTLLLAERYGVEVSEGLLYYPRSGEVVQVPRIDDELRGLVAMRNQMIEYLCYASETTERSLPPMLRREFICARCPHQAPCFIAHASCEDGSAATAGVGDDTWQALVGRLSPSHMAFVRKWLQLIDREDADMQRFRAELWTMGATYREQQTGRCIPGLRLQVGSFEDTGELKAYSRYRMSFEAAAGAAVQRSFLDSQIGVGDPIVVSVEGGQYALAIGYVQQLEYGRITVALDRPVRGVPRRRAGFDCTRNQDFEAIMDIRMRGSSDETVLGAEVPAAAGDDVFRIDKDEMKSTMGRVRAHLMRLFMAGDGERWRRLLVDLAAPTFAPLHANVEARVADAALSSQLNEGQALVLRRVLAANDYALVLGMPGTGKTTTIAALVRVLTALGKSVLLASYTHAAVDNILLKLLDDDIAMVRLGSSTRVHPRVAAQLLPPAGLRTVRQLDAHFRGAKVVATTCLGVTHPVFSMRKFDYCIIDEASQITLPICLGPLLEATRVVLVGDHHQLPPLVRNAGARDGGLGTSLFRRLCEAHPHAVVRLELQYRMAEGIQCLANNLIYDGHLRCGSSEVASRRISYTKSPADAIRSWPFAAPHPSHDASWDMDWVVTALDPAHAAVFIDTDRTSACECRADGSDSAQNDAEVSIVRTLTAILQECGIEGRRVAVLSPFRAQLRRLEIEHGIRQEHSDATSTAQASTDLSSAASSSTDTVPNIYCGIEMHTVDRYQGRDADIIIISWVRSNSAKAIGELLRDWHRINVAITRARLKLIMVGSRTTLARSPLLAAMLRILHGAGGIVTMPSNSLIPAAFSNCTGGQRRKSKQSEPMPTRASPEVLLRGHPVINNIIAENS
ncbi:DNA replication endonuclease-helicase Dna2 [Coemansia sp. RSA 988]|nr:DNA replication endonuclease-helicase Dna2 [Coemansia sp. RSA 988]